MVATLTLAVANLVYLQSVGETRDVGIRNALLAISVANYWWTTFIFTSMAISTVVDIIQSSLNQDVVAATRSAC